MINFVGHLIDTHILRTPQIQAKQKAKALARGTTVVRDTSGRPDRDYFNVLLEATALPPELVLSILDHAEIWSTAVTADRDVSLAHIQVHNNQVVTATTAPLTRWGVENLRRVIFRVTSRDQGWSDTRQLHGTYEGSYTWHEAAIKDVSQDSADTFELQRNIHAGKEFKDYTIVFNEDHEFFRSLAPHVNIQIVSCARFPGWVNRIRYASIETQFCDSFDETRPAAFTLS